MQKLFKCVNPTSIVIQITILAIHGIYDYRLKSSEKK